jgi:predicted XRE-type DNA-binding protein
MPTGVYPHKRRTLQELFLRYTKIPDNLKECWIWVGSTNGRYGKLTCRPPSPARGVYPPCVNLYAHRVSYTLYRGEIPDGLEVLHNCPTGDNPLCVNPMHLFLGTQKENIQDASRKGRMRLGKSNPATIFSDATIHTVFQLDQQGIRQYLIAERLGISRQHVSNILQRKRRKFITIQNEEET